MRRFLMTCAVLLLSCAGSLGAQTVLCESLGAYRECRVGSSGTIRLVMEMTPGTCFEGSTWGTREVGVVWVDRGCRATFTVSSATGNSARASKRVACESRNGERVVCPVDIANGVAFTQQLSKSACVQGESWGFDDERELVWVDHDCRAEFILGQRTDPVRPLQALDGLVTCESADGRRKECAADTSAGVQIVRELSDAECSFGRQWGYDAKGIWVTKGCRAEFAIKGKPKAMVRAIVCASENNARNVCAADTQYGVALVRSLGGDCVLDQSWGFDKDGVWVTNGCHAQFALGGYRLPPGAVPATAATMRCESTDGKRTQCPVDTARGVGLIRQLSTPDCVLNRTWGYDTMGIWVTDGCRAEFAVAK